MAHTGPQQRKMHLPRKGDDHRRGAGCRGRYNHQKQLVPSVTIEEVTEAVQNFDQLAELAGTHGRGPGPGRTPVPDLQCAEDADALGPCQTPGSPVTAEDDRALDTPGGFSRAPGDRRPLPGSPAGASGRRITGRTNEGPKGRTRVRRSFGKGPYEVRDRRPKS